MIEIEPGNVRHRILLANLYWESGKADKAQEVLKALTAADPKNEEAWIGVAGFYLSSAKSPIGPSRN